MQADDDIDAVAKETLGKAIQSARLGEAGKEFAYGNKAGRGLLGDVHEMKRGDEEDAESAAESYAPIRRPPGPNRSSPTSRR